MLQLIAIVALALAAPATLLAQTSPIFRWAGDAEGGAPYVEADPADPSRVVGFDVDVAEFLAAYRGTAVALAGEAKRSLYDVDLVGPVAIVVGSEGAGLSAAVRERATMLARIPMPGRAESLNAAVAGSLALFEAVRQRKPA